VLGALAITMYRYSPYGGGRSKARKGEGWHKRGWRDEYGNMAVNVQNSPKVWGQHTMDVQPHETAEQMLRSAKITQAHEGTPPNTHCVLYHKKRELVGQKTAADYGIESADTLYLKVFDSYGNQLRWDTWGFVKQFQVTDSSYGTLEAAFAANAYTDEDTSSVKRLARAAGVNPGVVSDWFSWRRAIGAVGGVEPGDRGLVAQANRRAENATARATADRAAAEAATLAAHAAQAALQQQQWMQQNAALRVKDETIRIRPDVPGTPWFEVTAGADRGVAPLLDTGNEARTMINPRVAADAGIRAGAGAPMMAIRGINGVENYPTVYVRIQLRGEEQRILAAIGGDQGVLVGRDVLEPMLDKGFTIAGFSAARHDGGAVGSAGYCIQPLQG
jgi:hypothetical protein